MSTCYKVAQLKRNELFSRSLTTLRMLDVNP